MPALTSAEIIPATRAPSPAVGAALTTFCTWPALMSWQVTAPMTGGREPLAQPALGVGVLAGPPLVNREPVGVEVVGHQVRAGPFHLRRVGREPIGDILQLGGQLLLGRRLALLPLAVLVPDGPPPAALGPGRVECRDSRASRFRPGAAR